LRGPDRLLLQPEKENGDTTGERRGGEHSSRSISHSTGVTRTSGAFEGRAAAIWSEGDRRSEAKDAELPARLGLSSQRLALVAQASLQGCTGRSLRPGQTFHSAVCIARARTGGATSRGHPVEGSGRGNLERWRGRYCARTARWSMRRITTGHWCAHSAVISLIGARRRVPHPPPPLTHTVLESVAFFWDLLHPLLLEWACMVGVLVYHQTSRKDRIDQFYTRGFPRKGLDSTRRQGKPRA